MGCTSSTEVVTDPVTGQTKEKKKFGGSYPGNRRPQNAPYVPPASEFQKTDGGTSQATAHFVAYGGGNALVLMNPSDAAAVGGGPQPATGGPAKEFIQVTLPAGVKAGDTIHVQAPDGRLNAIVVPPGMGPGSTFTVEFADAPPPTAATAPEPYVPAPFASATPVMETSSSSAAAPASTPAPTPPQEARQDDGFASGFNNPYASSASAAYSSSYPSAPAYPPSYGR